MSVQSLFFGRWFTTSQQFPVSYIEYSSEEHEKRFSIHHRFQSNNTEDRTAGETERTTFSKLIMFLILCREGRGGYYWGLAKDEGAPAKASNIRKTDRTKKSRFWWWCRWKHKRLRGKVDPNCYTLFCFFLLLWVAGKSWNRREREWTKHCRCSIRTIHHE